MDIVILAGGLGSRFFANSSKIAANFWGIPVLKMLCLNSLKISNNVYTILRNDFKDLPSNVVKIKQKSQYGTGAAAQSYFDYVKESKDVLIIPGDAPLVDYEVMETFFQQSLDSDVVLGIMQMPDFKEYYGRVFIKEGYITKILEYKQYEEKTDYANTGIIYLSKKVVPLLNELRVQKCGEIYLTEIVELAIKNGYKVKPIVLKHEEALGFNNISEFHVILEIAQEKWRKKALESQAIFFDIESVYLSYDTEFSLGSVIEPYNRFLPGVKIGPKGTVKSFCSLENCYVNGTVGPFANIRSGEIQDNAQIGSFVEVNRSIIGKNTKSKHLAYLGDAKIGDNSNIGAGCVVCNYDGKNKHQTLIGENSFVGANTTLIAPIKIGNNTLLAAGSTFNKDVEDNMLSIARSYQINKIKNPKS